MGVAVPFNSFETVRFLAISTTFGKMFLHNIESSLYRYESGLLQYVGITWNVTL